MARIRNKGELSAGAATTTACPIPSSPKICSMNSFTSRPRSPIKPITTTSAEVNLVNMPNKTLLPTPDPAIRPSRCPHPTVSMALIAFTPTSSTRSIGGRCIGLIGLPCRPRLSLHLIGAKPSRGSPNASTTRPSRLSPTIALSESESKKTLAPACRPEDSHRGIIKIVPLWKPTT